MTVIIDTNAVSITFDSKNSRHSEFKPVVDHLLNRDSRVKLVYGGTKYLQEVNNFRKFIHLFAELNRIRKLVKIPCNVVDAKHAEIDQINLAKGRSLDDDRYNDGHIMALAITSRSKLIVTSDRRSIDFLKERCFYAHASHIPSFYTSERNEDMLSDPAYF